jgi:hypothetical protein
MNDLIKLLAVATAVCAWVVYAEHPTARNLRRAIVDTLELG